MNYPVWEVPLLGGGLIIALIAIPHIFVSHFAVGGGIYLAFSERLALRDGNTRLLDFLKRNSFFFILITLVFGAVGGVGIWFSIGLVHPPATSVLIHNFVFAWAIEWVFFLVEIAAALLYYYSWTRVDPKTHNTIGWIYAVSAWMSLFVINGILTFMLTPGDWPANPSFWSSLFNPGYWPSLFVRTFACIALAGLYTMFMASREPAGENHDMLVRYSAKWLMPAFIGLPLSGAWYLTTLPPMALELSQGGSPAVTIFAAMSLAISAVLFIFAYFIAFRNPQSVNPPVAILFMMLGLAVTGATEWTREAVRKPFVIYNYMYSNATTVDQIDDLRETGVLQASKWTTIKEVTEENILEAGSQVFTVQCAHCHTVDGYNAIRLMTAGWSQPFLSRTISHLDELKGFMPPFAGNAREREALATWIVALDPKVREGMLAGEIPMGRLLPTTMGEVLSVAGEQVWDDNCSGCHSISDEDDNPITPKVAGKSQSELSSIITELENLEGFMPPFEGSDDEREALATWLTGLEGSSAGGAQ
jgi:mono/diheme cytochrome c family protein